MLIRVRRDDEPDDDPDNRRRSRRIMRRTETEHAGYYCR